MTVKNIYQSFTHKMAAKASWHRKYVTVTLCIEKKHDFEQKISHRLYGRARLESQSFSPQTDVYLLCCHSRCQIRSWTNPKRRCIYSRILRPDICVQQTYEEFFSWSSRQHCPMEVVGAYAGPILRNFSGCTIFRGPPLPSSPSPPLRSRSLRSRVP